LTIASISLTFFKFLPYYFRKFINYAASLSTKSSDTLCLRSLLIEGKVRRERKGEDMEKAEQNVSSCMDNITL